MNNTLINAGVDDKAFVITPLKLTTYASRIRKIAVDIGDGSSTVFNITHDFNTYDVIINWCLNSSEKDDAEFGISIIDRNTVQIVSNIAPSVNSLRVVITG